MFKFCVISAVLFIFVKTIDSSYEVRDVYLIGHRTWFRTVVSDLILQLEFEGWSRIRASGLETAFNHSAFGVEISGRANYTDGFLMSLERAETFVSMQSINQIQKTISVRGNFAFHGVRFGYDVDIELNNGTKFASSVVNHLAKIEFEVIVIKSTNTDEMTISIRRNTIGIQSVDFKPANDITSVVAINCKALIQAHLLAEVLKWGEIWSEKLRKIILKDAPFPKVCVNCSTLVQ